jgi:hypothetical protein
LIQDKTNRLERIYSAIETGNVELNNLSPRIKALNDEIGQYKREKEYLELKLERGDYPTPNDETLKPYVEDLHKTILKGTLFERKSFIRSFVKRIVVAYPHATVEYSVPLKKESKNPKKEVLAFDLNGSPELTITAQGKPKKLNCLYHSSESAQKGFCSRSANPSLQNPCSSRIHLGISSLKPSATMNT